MVHLWCTHHKPTVYQIWYKSGKPGGNAGFIQNVPRFPVSQRFTCSVPRVFPIYTKFGTLWVYDGYTINVPFRIISGTPFWLILNFTSWEHHNHTTGKTAKNTLNEPLRNITGTFFGNIQDVPIIFPKGTSQSHDLEHCKCIDHFLGWEIAGKPAGKILDVLEMYQVGSGLVHCPCPCDGLAVFQPGTLDFAPSVPFR